MGLEERTLDFALTINQRIENKRKIMEKITDIDEYFGEQKETESRKG